MIVVVEGISASGKSTWCARHGAGHVIAETGRREWVPDGEDTSETAAAKFWIELNTARWGAALSAEKAGGTAICDTDPLKLHYAWCLWQIGEGSQEQWNAQLAETRKAFLSRRIGFADAYLVGEIDPQLARRRRDEDQPRQRRNFELHVRLQPPLLMWYRTLASVLPCAIVFGLPESFSPSNSPPVEARYDVTLFDRAMALLPRR